MRCLLEKGKEGFLSRPIFPRKVLVIAVRKDKRKRRDTIGSLLITYNIYLVLLLDNLRYTYCLGSFGDRWSGRKNLYDLLDDGHEMLINQFRMTSKNDPILVKNGLSYKDQKVSH